MSKKAKTIANIPFILNGIPCLIGVESYTGQKPFKGSAYNCDSDWDYRGFEDIEYSILDRKGYYAEWLSKKLDKKIKHEIEKTIKIYFSE